MRWHYGTSTPGWIAAVAALSLALALPLLLIPPRGDYPVNDDFDYAASASGLARTGRLGLTDWPTVTLVAHAAWGAGFLRLFGGGDETLRASTIVLSIAGALALFRLTARRHGSPIDAVFFATWYYLSPLTLVLSYTYMTDVPGAAATLIGLNWASSARFNLRTYVVCGFLGAWSLMIRQTAAIWAVVHASLLGFGVAAGRIKPSRFLAATIPMAAAWAAYRVWLLYFAGEPSNGQLNLLSLRPLLEPKLLITKGLCLALAMGLQIAPAAVWRLKGSDFANPRWGVVALLLLVMLVGGRRNIRVYEGTEIRDLALGDGARIEQEIAFRGPVIQFLGDVGLFDVVVYVLGTAGLAAFLAVILRPAGTGRKQPLPTSPDDPRFLQTVAAATMLATFAALMIVESLFDRYFLTLAVPAGVWLAARSPNPASRAFPTAGLCLLSLYALVGILGVQDSQVRTEVVWRAARSLEARGVPPREINAGFEHAAVHSFLPLYWRGSAPARPYLSTLPPEAREVERLRRMPHLHIYEPARRYTLAWRPISGLAIEEEVPWQSWFRRGVLYILRNPSAP